MGERAKGTFNRAPLHIGEEERALRVWQDKGWHLSKDDLVVTLYVLDVILLAILISKPILY
jgi:hypothetical protein